MATKQKLNVVIINQIEMIPELISLISTYHDQVINLHSRLDSSLDITREGAQFLKQDMINRHYVPKLEQYGKEEAAEVEAFILQNTINSFKLSKK